jgi:hypothetical protein
MDESSMMPCSNPKENNKCNKRSTLRSVLLFLEIIMLLGLVYLLRSVIMALVVIPYFYLEDCFYHETALKSAIPAQIHVARIVAEGRPWYGDCGVTVFVLSAESIREIQDKKLQFFQGITSAEYRSHFGLTREQLKWMEWKDASASQEDSGKNDIAFDCAANVARNWRGQFDRAMKTPGNYYTYRWTSSHSTDVLWLFPDLGVAVYSSS